jgi:3-hydroxyanthranilate 3,4-dioxygenase
MDRRNRHLLQPPVGNKICIKNLELHCNACCRPNARKDYHYNETEELFYQLEGSIKIVIQEEGVRKEMEQCGRYVFASCQCSSLSVRSAGSIGLVIERKRVGKRLRTDFMALRQLQPQTVQVKFELKISKRFLAAF